MKRISILSNMCPIHGAFSYPSHAQRDYLHDGQTCCPVCNLPCDEPSAETFIALETKNGSRILISEPDGDLRWPAAARPPASWIDESFGPLNIHLS